jgi:hypothetical protein
MWSLRYNSRWTEGRAREELRCCLRGWLLLKWSWGVEAVNGVVAILAPLAPRVVRRAYERGPRGSISSSHFDIFYACMPNCAQRLKGFGIIIIKRRGLLLPFQGTKFDQIALRPTTGRHNYHHFFDPIRCHGLAWWKKKTYPTSASSPSKTRD